MSRLQVAVVGAGLMGRWHARYACRNGAEISAIVDSRHAALTGLGKRYRRAHRFLEFDECLDRCPFDVVHICSGTDSHAHLVERSLQSHKHVLVEKPLTPSWRQTRRLVELAERRGLLVTPVHQFPFQRGFGQLVKHWPTLGDVVRMTYRARSAGGVTRSEDERRQMLLEFLPHAASLFFRLIGDRLSQCAWSVCRQTSDELDLVGEVDHRLLCVEISLRGRPTCNELMIVGTERTALVDLFHGYFVSFPGRVSRLSKILQPFRQSTARLSAAGINLGRRAVLREPAYPGLRELIAKFYDAVRGRGKNPVGAEEVFASARLMDHVRGASAYDTQGPVLHADATTE